MENKITCECGNPLCLLVNEIHSKSFKLRKDGTPFKKPYEVAIDIEGFLELFCNKCGNMYEGLSDEDSERYYKGRITREGHN